MAFVASKYRLGMDPAPFVLEMDTTTTPWAMTDITAKITQDATQALQARKSAERQKLEEAAFLLAHTLRTKTADTVMLKKEAEGFLRAHGHLTARQAANLLENGFNHDIHPDGLWVLREITGQRGHPIGVYLAAHDFRAHVGEEKEDVRNKGNTESPHQYSLDEKPISHSSQPGGVRNDAAFSLSDTAASGKADFVHHAGSACTKSASIFPAETLGENVVPDFVHSSHTPDEPCLHEHVDDTASWCYDCGVRLIEEAL